VPLARVRTSCYLVFGKLLCRALVTSLTGTVLVNVSSRPALARFRRRRYPLTTLMRGHGSSDLTEPEFRRDVLRLRRRVQKLTALLRSPWPCSARPGFASQESGCRTNAPGCGSWAPSISLVSTSRRERSCGSCGCRRLGSRLDAGGRARVALDDDQSSCPAHHHID
jgi:hypothetical protein